MMSFRAGRAALVVSWVALVGAICFPGRASAGPEGGLAAAQAPSIVVPSAAAPLWYRDGQLTAAARGLIETLAAAGDFGLQADDYGVASLKQGLLRLSEEPGSATELAAIDAELSVAATAFLHDLHYGRIAPAAAGFELPRREPFDFGPTLRQLAAGHGDAIAQVEPQLLHYRLLKQALGHYRRLAADPSLTRLPPMGTKVIKGGGSYAGAPALRRLLAATGDLPIEAASSSEPMLDPQLVGALRRFQFLHGLPNDGALGRTTFAALTVPFTQRVRAIELTLERMRWLPAFQGTTLIVNIPQFRLYVLNGADDREADMLRMDVIVGQEYPRLRTPVFAADMTSIVFRPFWDVPISIARRELVPLLRRSPAALEAQHLEIVASGGRADEPLPLTAENLAGVNDGRLRLRQRPGADNALGLIKFVLPNPYGVYLHSTSAPQLFARPRRSYSHGCIRVSEPVALAAEVLRGTPGDWNATTIEAAMQGDTRTVPLQHPVHVWVLYGTAIASEDGSVRFFEDLYGHDRKLEALLAVRRY